MKNELDHRLNTGTEVTYDDSGNIVSLVRGGVTKIPNFIKKLKTKDDALEIKRTVHKSPISSNRYALQIKMQTNSYVFEGKSLRICDLDDRQLGGSIINETKKGIGNHGKQYDSLLLESKRRAYVDRLIVKVPDWGCDDYVYTDVICSKCYTEFCPGCIKACPECGSEYILKDWRWSLYYTHGMRRNNDGDQK